MMLAKDHEHNKSSRREDILLAALAIMHIYIQIYQPIITYTKAVSSNMNGTRQTQRSGLA
jgi:hypothetical protein